MLIERAVPRQTAALTKIAFTAKRHRNYPERWIEIWSPLLTITPEFIAEADVWVALMDEEPAGFYALTHSGERTTLKHLWVLPRALPVMEIRPGEFR
jgi:hypothetical protein